MGRFSILDRNKTKRYELKISQPIRQHVSVTPYLLVELLFSLHETKRLKPAREFKSYLKGAKSFLELTGDKAVETMMEASKYTKHPFSFKYLREFYEKNYLQNDR